MLITDRLTIEDGTRKTAEGYLVASVRVARIGIQHYTGREIDPNNEHGFRDRDSVAVYRPEEEVFSVDSLRSFSMLDITSEHPKEPVTADNWRKYAVGSTGESVLRDGDFIRIPMMIKDAAAIREIEAGKVEVSTGYDTELVWGAGTTPDGLAFDAKQTTIRANHIATCDRARGGHKLRIGDGTTMAKTILHDGISIEFGDQAADAYNALAARITKLTADAAAASTAHTAALATKDAELAKRDATIDSLKAQVVDGAALDALVQKRADLVTVAKALHDADYKGKSDMDIRKTVLAAKGIALDGKSDAYIEARFDTLADAVKVTDPARAALSAGIATAPGTAAPQTLDAMRKAANESWQKSVTEMTEAYKPKSAH